MAVAYMATAGDDPPVLGFYMLGAPAVRADYGPKSWQWARVTDVPVIYLRADAVRKNHQGMGLGTALVIDALRRCLGIADQMDSAAVLLDVLEDDHFDRRRAFDEALGFRALGDPENPPRVYVPMADVRSTLS